MRRNADTRAWRASGLEPLEGALPSSCFIVFRFVRARIAKDLIIA